MSRRAGYAVAYRCWDLEYVNQQKAWRLLCHVSDPTLIAHLNQQEQGTIVFWEDMDRLTGGLRADDPQHEALFGRALEQVSRHLAMVFHRYMEDGSVQIRINGHTLVPWDPFLSAEPATQRLPDETLFNGQVSLRSYILPHHRRLSHPDVFEQASGPRGWNAHQGFYIYRNRCLLVPGDWLGLFRRDEHCKLARIMVDLPNTLDEEWQIDIRKAQSRPPAVLRRDLERIGSHARTQASGVYRARGKKLQRTHNLGFVPVWNENVRQGRRHYTINRSHPLLEQLLQQVSGPASALLHTVLRLAEESVPVPLIAQNEAESPLKQALPYEFVAEGEVAPLLQQFYNDYRSAGIPADEARQMLLLTEPFNYFPELIAELT